MSGPGSAKGDGRDHGNGDATEGSTDDGLSGYLDLLGHRPSTGRLLRALLGLVSSGLAGLSGEDIRRRRLNRDPPSHPTRQEILEALTDDPGLNHTELCDRLDIARGTARYHLHQLEDDDRIYSLSTGRERHHFPRGLPRETAEKLSAIRSGRAEDIALTVLDDPGLIQQDLGDRVSMSRKVLRHNLDRLTDAGVIDEQTVGRSRQYYPTEAFESLASVLDDGLRDDPDGRDPIPPGDGPDADPGDGPTDVDL